MSDINGRLTEEVGLFWYQDWGRRLDPHKVEGGFCILGWKGLDSAQNQVAILHFGKKKV